MKSVFLSVVCSLLFVGNVFAASDSTDKVELSENDKKQQEIIQKAQTLIEQSKERQSAANNSNVSVSEVVKRQQAEAAASANTKNSAVGAVSGNNASVKDLEVLFAPFSAGGDDIFCRYPVAYQNSVSGAATIEGGGRFLYSTSSLQNSAAIKSCESSGGTVVQVIRASESDGPQYVLQRYVGKILLFTVSLGVGISVMMMVFGGIKTMASLSGEGDMSAGKDMIIKGLTGVLILILSAVILRTLNPLFFSF